MALARVPLTLAAALAFHISMSPPSTDIPDKPALAATARLVTAVLTKGLFWVSTLTDTLSAITHTHTLPAHLTPPPLAPLAGTTLALTGAYIRYTAYRALGRFYACRNLGPGPCAPGPRTNANAHAHVLITTGPYTFVRHPGYAGLLVCTAGLVVLHLDARTTDGVWVTPIISHVGITMAMAMRMRTIALACALLGSVAAVWRMFAEERWLRARFKGEWEAWASRVPYMLVPGVY